ncbi:hypothetical protein [Botrimarina mediterranea]|uniref:hypothetical protein n=1 Tax=Botrimarina mediterranea TaxID=2528022 RepID=UPI001187DF5C|nr:hypothetical protein K2D_24680 [Planctomycetes bacterium K2D]
MPRRRLFAVLAGAACIIGSPWAGAQTDPSNFLTVIDIPPAIAPASVGSSTQLNLRGGWLGDYFDAGASFRSNTDIEVNIYGGAVGDYFDAYSGSTINVLGGAVGRFFDAESGSRVNLLGGVVDIGFEAQAGTKVTLAGGHVARNFDAAVGSGVVLVGDDFRINGVPVVWNGGVGSEQPIDLPIEYGAVLSGTLADGAPIALSAKLGDNIAAGVLKLRRATLPPVGFASPNSFGIRDGQTLNTSSTLRPNFNAGHGSRLNVLSGGVASKDLEAFGAEVNVMGGRIEGGFVAFFSEVNLSSGRIDSLSALYNTTINVTGGELDLGFLGSLQHNSQLSMSGGQLQGRVGVESGSSAHLSGGVYESVSLFGGSAQLSGGRQTGRLTAGAGSTITMIGGEFRIDGKPVPGLDTPGATATVQVPFGSSISGVYSDGAPFAFYSSSAYGLDALDGAAITLERTSLPPVGDPDIVVNRSTRVTGLRDGQTLTLTGAGRLADYFVAGAGSTVKIESGTVGREFRAAGANVSIAGGTIGVRMQVMDGATVTMSGGEATYGLAVMNGSTLNQSGGVAEELWAFEGSTVNLYATQFSLDGIDLSAAATPYAPYEITQRNVPLEGTLADGTQFSHILASFYNNEATAVHPNATLTVTLFLPGDYDRSGEVDQLDYLAWRAAYGQAVAAPGAGADGNFDGVVDAADYTVWRDRLGDAFATPTQALAVPEPVSATLLLVGVLAASSPRPQ